MSQAGEVDITGTHPDIPTDFVTDNGTAIPVLNVLEILGTYVAAGTTPVETTGVGNTVTIEVQTSQAIAATDATKIGLSNFDSAAFSVDANGFVTLNGGGGAATNIDVDAHTAPGTDPVVPSMGNIIMTGAQVASGVVGANVIRTDSLAANTVTIEIQRSTAVAATDSTKNGVAHFDSGSFAVDANGFVTLAGGGLAIDSIGTQTGTNPIAPTAAGLVTINGAVVAAGTNPVRSDGTGANTMAIEVQISQAIAATDATKIGLANFDSAAFDVDANGFVQLNGGGIAATSINVDANTAPGTDPVVPTAAGQITMTGAQVASGTIGANVIRTDSLAANSLTIEIQRSTVNATSDSTKNGVSHFDSAAFDVDANGWVQLNGGGIATTSFDVQANTAPGTDPVVPTSAGVVTVNGAAVANHSVVLETRSRAANAYNLEIQYATSAAATDATKSGVAHFDSAAFTVDANGFVTLSGGTQAIDSIGVDATSGGGTNPVLPTVAGLVTVNGARVAAGTNPIRSVSTAANVYQIQVQTSQALVATDATKVGLANFDSASFAVDANGFVTASGTGLAKTITGDSGGALSPTAGNWNVLGLSGSKTSGSGSTLTIKSPPYADVAGSGSVTLNSGSFATGAITLTTPVTAGLADGDLLEFVATNGVLVIQMAATQVGHLGSATTSVAGTITGTATGDSISLRYQASTNDWWATSSIGIWSLA